MLLQRGILEMFAYDAGTRFIELILLFNIKDHYVIVVKR